MSATGTDVTRPEDQPGEQPGTPAADAGRLRKLLGPPEMAWLVDRIRGRLERGEPVDGTVTLVGATSPQRRGAARLLGHGVGRGTSLSIPLPEVADALRRSGAASSLQGAVEALTGPVRDLAAERAVEIGHFDDVLDRARSSPLASMPWYAAWLDEITRDGTVTRLIRQGHGALAGQAAAVLERIPGGPEPAGIRLADLAGPATGDAAALNSGQLPGLVLRALALREDVPAPDGGEAARALWTLAGVVGDDLASQVLVLNLTAGGEPLGRWLTEAAAAGQPFRVTLQQLIAMPVLPWALELFICTSPAVLRAAAEQLGPACPPLICTEGEPSVACARLLHAAVACGTAIRWHADFSWPGLRATTVAARRLRAEPWQMAGRDYQAALAAAAGEPLTGPPEPSPWDERLATLMRTAGRAITEERVAPQLVAALAAVRARG
ncbi:MAG TPA: TIGR02679 family protein [Streptosporangiaceae bacterium]|jgi:uncharacterized protein (TIGR02679 family)